LVHNAFGDTHDVKATTRFAAKVALSGVLGLSGLGLASGYAQAAPLTPFPDYHWCPGQYWDPGWGYNWETGGCHDDHHRDADFDNHDRDYWGDNGPGRWGPPPPPPPPPWGPPPPPCIPFVNCPP